MWTVIYMAKNDEALHNVCVLLDKNSIIYRAMPVSCTEADGTDAYYDILVPSAEVSAAHALILDEEL